MRSDRETTLSLILHTCMAAPIATPSGGIVAFC